MPSPEASLRKTRRHRDERGGAGNGSRRGFLVPFPTSALAAGLLAIVLAGASVFAWQAWPRDPGNDSAEAGFLRDMFTHHAQAVEMAMIIRDRTEDPELKAMATDIALTQSTQMGQMQGYLDLWDLSLTGDDAPMTWMDHPTDGLMPGMATPEQIAQLGTLPVPEAEVLFLQLMVRHHQGGVEMAEALQERSDQDEVVFIADRIVLLQSGEIGIMNAMLEVRGEAPVTGPLPEDHEGH